MVTINLSPQCHPASLGREDVSVSQFRLLRSSQRDARAHMKKCHNLCAQGSGTSVTNTNEGRGLEVPRRESTGAMHVQKTMGAVLRRERFA